MKIQYMIRDLNNQKKVKVIQLCPTLCDLMDCTVPEILQARILECVAFPFSRGLLPVQPRDQTPVSCSVGGFLDMQALSNSFTVIAVCLNLSDLCWKTTIQKEPHSGFL